MKKQTRLLSALALSVGLTLSASPFAVASIPSQVPGEAAIPSLAPMLEKVLPAVVSVQVEGTAAAPTQKVPEEFKKFFGDDMPPLKLSRLKAWALALLLMPRKGMC